MVARHLKEAAPGEGLVPATESNLVWEGTCVRLPNQAVRCNPGRRV
jgi:hypothetical protein